ncbi:MAG: zinc finger domain-containing protein [Nitrosotalea sp.]
MSSTIGLPVCTSCHRPIMPRDMCVKFNCPDCGSLLLWRCESCREAARVYKCSSCTFEGP